MQKKYTVVLTESWTEKEPFRCPWDYEMIGDELRAKFDKYVEDYKKEQKIVTGSSKHILEAEMLKKFMLRERINLVDDPATGGLISVFILRVGETKVIDERTAVSLDRYKERKEYNDKDEVVMTEGFLKIILVEGSEPVQKKSINVYGSDIEYFSPSEVEKVTIFKCEYPGCGKTFQSRQSLAGHKMSHLAKVVKNEKKTNTNK